jgi:hypothetical protein
MDVDHHLQNPFEFIGVLSTCEISSVTSITCIICYNFRLSNMMLHKQFVILGKMPIMDSLGTYLVHTLRMCMLCIATTPGDK